MSYTVSASNVQSSPFQTPTGCSGDHYKPAKLSLILPMTAKG